MDLGHLKHELDQLCEDATRSRERITWHASVEEEAVRHRHIAEELQTFISHANTVFLTYRDVAAEEIRLSQAKEEQRQ